MIYFIRAAGTDLFKIGYTKDNPSRRIASEIQTSSPHALFVERIFEGTVADEQAIHRMLHPYRRQGEWFELTVATLFEMLIDDKLGLKRKDERIIFSDPKVAVDTFLKDNFMMGRDQPREGTGISIDDLYVKYREWCRDNYCPHVSKDFIEGYLPIIKIGHKREYGTLMFNMRILENSKYRHNTRKSIFEGVEE